jgi:hypothetical protein
MFGPELCPLCETIFLPEALQGLLYYCYPTNETEVSHKATAPLFICNDCMDEGEKCLKKGFFHGRYDILADQRRRLVIDVESQEVATRKFAEYSKSQAVAVKKGILIEDFLSNCAGIRRGLRHQNTVSASPFDNWKEEKVTNEAGFHLPCNGGPSSPQVDPSTDPVEIRAST